LRGSRSCQYPSRLALRPGRWCRSARTAPTVIYANHEPPLPADQLRRMRNGNVGYVVTRCGGCGRAVLTYGRVVMEPGRPRSRAGGVCAFRRRRSAYPNAPGQAAGIPWEQEFGFAEHHGQDRISRARGVRRTSCGCGRLARVHQVRPSGARSPARGAAPYPARAGLSPGSWRAESRERRPGGVPPASSQPIR
jgi:hypothetical protein